MKRNNKKGFTIVELTIVIAVIAILAAVLIPTFSSVVDKANQSADIQLIRQVNTLLHAEDTYGTDLSTKEKALTALEANDIPSEKLKETSSKGNEFRYIPAEKRFVLWSTNDKKILFPEELAKEYANKEIDWDGTSTPITPEPNPEPNPEPTDVNYTVNHYTMDGKTTVHQATSGSGKVDSTVSITNLKQNIPGYEYKQCKVGGTVQNTDTITIKENLVIDLYYDAKTIEVTLKFNNNTADKTVWYKYGTAKFYSKQACAEADVTTVGNPEKTGYTFQHYSVNGKNYTSLDAIVSEFTDKVTLEAQWTANTYKLTLKNYYGTTDRVVWYKYESGKFYSEQECKTEITSEIQNPAKEGHTFAGYFNDTQKIEGDLTAVVGERTLTVQWTVNTYKLTYNWDLGENGVDFAQGDYIDTGFIPNWDQDFTITTTGRIDSFGTTNTLLFGNNVNDSTAERLGVDVDVHGNVNVYQGEPICGNKKMKQGAYALVFQWKASDKSFTLTITQTGHTVEYKAQGKGTGMPKEAWRFGGTDGRNDKQAYQGTHIDSFKIEVEYEYGATIANNLKTPTEHKNGSPKAGSWDKSLTTMPAADTTITAQWSK